MAGSLASKVPVSALLSRVKAKSLITLFSLLLLSPSLWGLGLGDLTHESVLGQPLEARIDLISGQSFGVNDIKVRQLSIEEASTMGIELLSYFNRFQLKPVEKDGQLYIKLYSTESVNEPFINLLVELKWPTGAVSREYTLLLDLPIIVEAPAANAKPTPQRSATKTPTSKPRKKQAPLQFSDQQYQVQSGDSLSKIAQRLSKNNQHNRNDIAHWLLVNNPHAFINNDANRLKAAVRLTLPQAVDLTQLQKQPTVAAATKTPKAETKTVVPVVTQQAEPIPKNEVPSAAAAVSSDARLSLKSSDAESEQLKERIRHTQEQNDRLSRENKAIEARINRLEGSSYIRSLERLVQLREQEITELNARLAGSANVAQQGEGASAERFIGSQGVVATIDSSITAAKQTEEPISEEEGFNRLWLWLILLLAILGSAYFYWHQKKIVSVDITEDETRDDDAELARLEQALEANDQSIGYDASNEDLNFSSLFDNVGRPTGAAHVGRFRPDPELTKKIQNKTESYTPDTPEGLEVVHHQEHDNLDDMISDALSYCAQGYFERAESMLLAEQGRSGPDSRITTALDYVAKKKWDS